jgi:hypothetical protein
MTTLPGSSDASSVKNEVIRLQIKEPIRLRGTEACITSKTINVLTGFGFVWPQGSSSVVITKR